MEFISLRDTFATQKEFDEIHSTFLQEFSIEKNIIMEVVWKDNTWVENTISQVFSDIQYTFFDASESYKKKVESEKEDFNLNKYDEKLLIARKLFENLKEQYNIAA